MTMPDETTTWWEASVWDYEPEPVTVAKETEHTITITGGPRRRDYRANKHSDSTSYYRTEQEAYAAIIARLESKLAHAKRQVEQFTESLQKAKDRAAKF